MSVKEFHIGDILSITTGRLVSPDHMSGIYNVLNFMTGQSLYTHQLIKAAQVYEPVLLDQHPQLRNVQVPEEFEDSDHVFKWLDEQIALFGASLPIVAMPELYDASNVLGDLFELTGNKDVIVVEMPDGEGI